jgi:preprotein translocase subunit SecF
MRRSLNQVFMRSLNTTLVTVIPIVTMLIVGSFVFGQQTLGDFSLALLIGLVSGTYSSIFVAAPLTVWLKEREPRWRDLRSRIAARGDDPADTAWYGVAGTGGSQDRSTRTVSTAASARSATAVAERTDDAPRDVGSGPSSRAQGAGSTVIPPRPRKQRRR